MRIHKYTIDVIWFIILVIILFFISDYFPLKYSVFDNSEVGLNRSEHLIDYIHL